MIVYIICHLWSYKNEQYIRQTYLVEQQIIIWVEWEYFMTHLELNLDSYAICSQVYDTTI